MPNYGTIMPDIEEVATPSKKFTKSETGLPKYHYSKKALEKFTRTNVSYICLPHYLQ